MTHLKESIDNYFKNRKEVAAVYLFGSYAKGQQKRFSDVDLGLLLHHSALHRSLEFQGQYIVDLGRLLRKDIHAVILNAAGELFLKQVFNKGKLIRVNSDKEFKQFRMSRFSMIAEFDYYLKMTQAGFRRKIIGEPKGG